MERESIEIMNKLFMDIEDSPPEPKIPSNIYLSKVNLEKEQYDIPLKNFQSQ